MLFWLISLLLTLGVVAVVVMPLLRPTAAPQDNPDVAVYRAQLDELDRDVERGVLAADEATRARTEVARRLLAAHKVAGPSLTAGKAPPVLSALVGAVVIAVAFGLYLNIGAPGYGDLPLKARLDASEAIRANRPTQSALQAAAPALPPVDAPAEYLTAIEQLRTIAPTRPDDLQAWELLAYHEAELRNFAAAAVAQQEVIRIKGETAGPEDTRQLLDLMVIAAGGYVSPEAEALARELLALDENHIAGRYYMGLLYDQTDRPDIAFRLWRPLVEEGDPRVYHVAAARALIEDTAIRAGVTYTPPTAPGPSSEDIANAQDMTEQDRQAMIGGMVAGLADRLATEGGPASDWARLITAYGVLGDLDAARSIWTEARDVFGADTAAMETLTAAAQSAGVLE